MHLHRLFDLLLISSLGRCFFSLSLFLSVAIPFSPYFTCFFPERGHATFPRQTWSFDVHQRRKWFALYWCNRRTRNLMFIPSGVYISRSGNWAVSKSYQGVEFSELIRLENATMKSVPSSLRTALARKRRERNWLLFSNHCSLRYVFCPQIKNNYNSEVTLSSVTLTANIRFCLSKLWNDLGTHLHRSCSSEFSVHWCVSHKKQRFSDE